jgi:hypothetical protein
MICLTFRVRHVNSCVGTCDLNITVKITLNDRKCLYSQDISLQNRICFCDTNATHRQLFLKLECVGMAKR